MGDERWTAAVDQHLDPAIRADLEDRLWRPIGERATLEAIVRDPSFLADPGTHPAMFADHGVVHARDVAAGVLRLLRVADGVLLPGRPPARHAFMEALGVATAYLHDLGMVDLTHAGRRVHAIAAAHAAFGPDVEPLVRHLLEPGAIRDRLDEVAAASSLELPVELVLRELLSLSVLHSKSVVPSAVLDDRVALHRLLLRIVYTDLPAHRAQARPPGADTGGPIVRRPGSAHPASPELAYGWLRATSGPQAALADDALDAMRALRAADVLRQRGTVLRTSGGFEVCMDAVTARAVCTMRPAGGDASFTVTYDDPRGAGEADIAEAQVTRHGDLRIAVHRGSFSGPGANELAVASVAGVVIDIVADVLPSFDGCAAGEGTTPPRVQPGTMRVQLERPPDRPAFAEEVLETVVALQPQLASRLATVADTRTAAPAERERYLAGDPVEPAEPEAGGILRRIGERGADVSSMHPVTAFAEVVRVHVQPGECLLAAGSLPAFAYVPMGEGLVVIPGGGYAPSPLPPWVPVGTTGIIRGAERNSDIVAERAVDVLAIPAERYVRAWFRPMAVEDLAARMRPKESS